MQTTYIKLAGVMLLGALDESGNYYVAVPALEKALEWREDSGREKLASKSLKDFAGKGLTVGKKKADHGGTLKLLSTKDLGILVAWEAQNGNDKASALLPRFFSLW